MGGDQRVVHVPRVAGGIAQPFQSLDLGEAVGEFAQPDAAAIAVEPMIGVDVLAEQSELLHPGGNEVAGFGQHLLQRPAGLGTAGIGHDAERAELVAAFLHGEEGGQPAGDGHVLAGCRQLGELVFFREVGVDHCTLQRIRQVPAALRLLQHLRQLVIGLRPEHQVDHRRAAGDLFALGLGDAAGDADHHVLAL